MLDEVMKGISDIADSVDKSISTMDFSNLGNDINAAARRMVTPTVREWHSEQYRQTKAASDNIRNLRQKYASQMNRTVEERQAYESIRKGYAKPASDPHNRKYSPALTSGYDAIPGWLMAVSGGVFGAFFTIMGLAGLALHSPAAMVVGFGLAAANLYLLSKGGKLISFSEHAKKYAQIIGDRSYVAIREFTEKTGLSKKKVIKELKALISSGKIRNGAIDEDCTTLMLTDDVYQAYVHSKALQTQAAEAEEKGSGSVSEEKDDLPEDVQRVITEGSQYIRTLREDNDRIPDDDEMSDKLYRLEGTIKKIVAAARSHPDSAPDLRRVTEYYLPTTDKLVKAYIELDGDHVTGENIEESRRQIMEALDMINEAFGKILDNMYENMNWDLKSDIKVMQRMFEQDGLAGEKAFDLSGREPELVFARDQQQT